MYMFHTGNGTWEARAYVDGAEVGQTEGTPVQVGSGTITFDAQGHVSSGGNMQITANWAVGGNTSTTVDMSKFTGYALGSAFTSITSDGVVAGTAVGFSFGSDGSLVALLSNGNTTSLGTLALASFRNPNGLERVGDNRFAIGMTSGEAIISTPTQNGLGNIAANSLENSNVDLATQFIDMVRIQRGYQAGSQVITTISDVIATTIQIARG